ncbi:MAG: cell division ATPase MinD [Nanoarchaeota archaeon]
MSKIIVICSGKGGVGKTTSSINIASAIKHLGGNVLVIDGNLNTPNLGIHLNSPEVPVHLNHVLAKKAKLQEAIYEHHSGLRIIPSSLSINEMKKVKPEKMIELRNDLKKLADYIIIDCSAGLNKDTLSILQTADEVIIITNPEMPALTDALKTIKITEELNKPVIGVIVNRVRKDDLETRPNIVKEMLEIPVLGMIPEDLIVKRALNEKNSVVHAYPRNRVARAYKEIASDIIGVNYDSNKDRESVVERMLNKLFRK